MAIDTTPSTVATNALSALDFSALIGGPMDAIVKAQALAAQTTYEFIKEVGLTTDPDTGEKKPINVTFQYNSNGQVTTLTVPLIVILTIPNIEVSSFVIDFIANISASSSSTEETSSDTELGVDVEAEASLQVGPFSLKVTAKANYSSKQHSKAAQESKYSVEYTMNVRVEGGQSGMPGGLQTVLNILQGSNTSVNPQEMVSVSPPYVDMDGTNRATLGIVVKDRQGFLASGTLVTLNMGSNSPFKEINVVKGHEVEDANVGVSLLSKSPYSTLRKSAPVREPKHIISHRVLKPYARRFQNSPNTFATVLSASGNVSEKSGVTDTNGNIVFELLLSDSLTEDQQGTIAVTGYIPVTDQEGQQSTREEVTSVPYAILVPTDGAGSLVLTANTESIDLSSSGTTSKNVKAYIKDAEENPVEGEDITFLIQKSDGSEPASDAFKELTGSGTSSDTGETTFKVELGTTPAAGDYVLVASNDSAADLRIPITVS